MAIYRISGIWKNESGVITHYAFHLVSDDGSKIGFAQKKAKNDAVALLEQYGNSATTWLWDYSNNFWKIGNNVHVVSGVSGKFLRSNHDNTEKDNLNHLIDYDWLRPLFK
ncbi:DUF3892 domain-containing protein [Flavobacterium sp. NRK1]|uniref:DUF3892 domain-containing protein n=1 Tax=Flavobacterium sp. NRK1 TaxID=2954929 RepID=UPI0020929CEE|nr:DUF3892 domain-containing protein [Flavobacterium sp. NRK1]MCO6148389.1 DUF3892 domain-containing protein [Flavobacterium sp. NRK1]